MDFAFPIMVPKKSIARIITGDKASPSDAQKNRKINEKKFPKIYKIKISCLNHIEIFQKIQNIKSSGVISAFSLPSDIDAIYFETENENELKNTLSSIGVTCAIDKVTNENFVSTFCDFSVFSRLMPHQIVRIATPLQKGNAAQVLSVNYNIKKAIVKFYPRIDYTNANNHMFMINDVDPAPFDQHKLEIAIGKSLQQTKVLVKYEPKIFNAGVQFGNDKFIGSHQIDVVDLKSLSIWNTFSDEELSRFHKKVSYSFNYCLDKSMMKAVTLSDNSSVKQDSSSDSPVIVDDSNDEISILSDVISSPTRASQNNKVTTNEKADISKLAPTIIDDDDDDDNDVVVIDTRKGLKMPDSPCSKLLAALDQQINETIVEEPPKPKQEEIKKEEPKPVVNEVHVNESPKPVGLLSFIKDINNIETIPKFQPESSDASPKSDSLLSATLKELGIPIPPPPKVQDNSTIAIDFLDKQTSQENEEKAKKEEEERKRREEEARKLEEEKERKAKEDLIKMLQERKKMEEEEKRRKEEEENRMREAEEERRRIEEEERLRKEAEDRRIREEQERQRKMEEDRRMQEEERRMYEEYSSRNAQSIVKVSKGDFVKVFDGPHKNVFGYVTDIQSNGSIKIVTHPEEQFIDPKHVIKADWFTPAQLPLRRKFVKRNEEVFDMPPLRPLKKYDVFCFPPNMKPLFVVDDTKNCYSTFDIFQKIHFNPRQAYMLLNNTTVTKDRYDNVLAIDNKVIVKSSDKHPGEEGIIRTLYDKRVLVRFPNEYVLYNSSDLMLKDGNIKLPFFYKRDAHVKVNEAYDGYILSVDEENVTVQFKDGRITVYLYTFLKQTMPNYQDEVYIDHPKEVGIVDKIAYDTLHVKTLDGEMLYLSPSKVCGKKKTFF